MNLRNSKLLMAIGATLCLAGPQISQAGPLGSYLTFDGPSGITVPLILQAGGEDRLQDDSLSAYVPNPNGTRPGFNVGDIIYGMITMSNIGASGRDTVNVGATDQVMILFSAQVTSFGASATGLPLLNLGATDASTPYDLAQICGAICSGAGIDGNSIGVALTTTQGESALSNGANPLNWSTSNFTSYLNGGGGRGPWGWEATIGLVGDTDFFQFQTTDPADIQVGGQERGAFTVQSSVYDVEWLPVDMRNFNRQTVFGQVTLDQGLVDTNITQEQLANGWTFKDQSTFYANPVPEPGTLALLGIALAGLGGTARRRLQK